MAKKIVIIGHALINIASEVKFASQQAAVDSLNPTPEIEKLSMNEIKAIISNIVQDVVKKELEKIK